MKKIGAIVIASILALSISACKSETTSNDDINKQKYIIATNEAFAPFEYIDSNGNLVGIAIDVVHAIAQDQGLDVEIVSEGKGFNTALDSVSEGKIDGAVAGVIINDDRREKFEFSDSYYSAETTFAVAKGSNIRGYKDLKGKKVGVKCNSNSGKYGKSFAEKYGYTVVEYREPEKMYKAVENGDIAACFEVYPTMKFNIKNGYNLEIPDGVNSDSFEFGFAVAKGKNTELITAFKVGLDNIKNNGEYQKILYKYSK